MTDSEKQDLRELALDMLALETAEGIASCDWRKWEELAITGESK